VRALFTGGAPVPPALARLLADGSVVAGIAHVVYGSTEAEPIASIEAREMLRAMAGDVAPPAGGVAAAAEGGRPVPTDGTAAEGARASPTGGPFAGGSAAEGARPSPTGGICAGFPVPQIALRLIRPFDGPVELAAGGWRDWEVAAGETGEVVVSGPHVLTGYWNDPAADRENKIREGGRVWHRTGDAARLDSRGRLWLMGRIGQRVQRAGRVWWSAPAELRALASPGVRHAAYFGLPDPGLGQRAVLCVEVAGGRLAPTARELLLAGMSPIPVDELHALEHIPRDPRHRSKTDVEGLVRALGG
jgi:acyl-CoA synthetase (AMP-forming)/AMP-acid ligase II